MKIGDTLIVVRVLRGQKPPKGFTHRHDAADCHHHKCGWAERVLAGRQEAERQRMARALEMGVKAG